MNIGQETISHAKVLSLGCLLSEICSVCYLGLLARVGLSPVEAVRNVIFLLRQSTPPYSFGLCFHFFTTFDETYVVSEKLARLSQGRFARHLLRGL